MFKKRTELNRLEYISQAYKKWSNATGNVKTLPLRTFRPKCKDDIVAIIEDARKKKISVRAVGAGHSFSEVAKEEYYVIEPFELTDCGEYTTALRDNALEPGRHLVKAQAGIRIKCLNRKLNKLGLALDNMGAFDWQTVSGALSTGTHGTGYKRPAFPDMVRAIILICANGETWQIEPSNGITDPNKFNHNAGIILKQNDDLFYSTVLSFGAMGIIYELVFEVQERFWIEESRNVTEWDGPDGLKEKIKKGNFQQWVEKEYDFVSFRINPYYTKNKKTSKPVRLCNVALQKASPGDPPMNRGWGAYSRNLFYTAMGNLGLFSWFLVRMMNLKPKDIPKFINGAIKGTSDKLFISRSYRVLYQTGLGVRKHGISSEFAFDLDYEKLVQVLDALVLHFKDLEDRYGIYQSAHIPVRFVPQSKAYLSQCFDGPQMYIDLPTLEDVNGAAQLLELNQEFMLKMGGVPHWGKVNKHLYTRPGFINQHYLKADIWRVCRANMDPDGMFYNDFIKGMGL